MSPDPWKGFLEVEEDSVEARFCGRGHVYFVLEIEKCLRGVSTLSGAVLEGRKNVVEFKIPE